ncbi:hypothetical protein TCAL_04029 [Tigriopus californicus]|uniref:Uncharacterized protein n=1 Tax=Tigriopus californicus TaxID=6832 RepID=A0A553PH41_TIGCA|nr:uncharacterized protein LOC131881196 isoform X1 [Tigriopus californicus]TRY77002.1 hypothetical protein TCAL_04029 [Tigriopus californicus]|eukprot:TCALIF_04029-PA protein Name:"Protein of unknown function" AED:0.00 eAED:0.00 QI:139/1/1/1/0/1/2/15/166
MIHSAKQQFAIAISFCLLFQTTCVHGDGQYLQSDPVYSRPVTSVDYYHGPYRYQNAQLAPRQSRQATAADFTGLSMVAAAAVGVGTGLLVHNVLTQKMNQLDEVVRDQGVALDTLSASLSNTQVVCNAVRQAGLATPLTGPPSAQDNAIAINTLLAALRGVTMCTS